MLVPNEELDLFRVGSEKPLRAVLLAALAPWDGGSRRICVRLAREIRVGQLLPIPAIGPCMTQAAVRRGDGHGAGPVVGVRHLVGTRSAGCGPPF